MKTVVITGATGLLGSALARLYVGRGYEVIGMTRDPDAKPEGCTRVELNAQRSFADAEALLRSHPDLVVLCAGAIETEVDSSGLPLPGATRAIYEINAIFPSLVALAAAGREAARPLDVVAIGSIADGMPSAFGPVYHASKIALHYFFQGVAPIARSAGSRVRLRVYRPGVIRGPLAWAPMLRLGERGRRLRERRCAGAPGATTVALRVADWIDGDAWVGSHDEPLSFRMLGILFALAPNLYARLQHWAWRQGNRFS